MQISIRQWHELDLREIARLTYAAKEARDQTSEQEAIERIVRPTSTDSTMGMTPQSGALPKIPNSSTMYTLTRHLQGGPQR